MPAYTNAVAPALVPPCGSFTHLDGTEPVFTGYKSAVFQRGGGPGSTWYLSGCPGHSTIEIQGSNRNIDSTFSTITTIGTDAAGNGYYTDIGYALFYRAEIATLAAGDIPVLIAQR